MRISDWSSDVCSSDLGIDIADADIARQLEPAIGIFVVAEAQHQIGVEVAFADGLDFLRQEIGSRDHARALRGRHPTIGCGGTVLVVPDIVDALEIFGRARIGFNQIAVEIIASRLAGCLAAEEVVERSEEHTSELPSLKTISYTGFALQK